MNIHRKPGSSPHPVAEPLLRLLGVGDFLLASDDERKKATFTFSFLGFVILLSFALFDFTVPDARVRLQGVFLFLQSIFFMLPVVLLSLWHKGKARLVENLLVVFAFFIFVTFTIFGGYYGDAIYWTFVYPYLIFFIRGQRAGWLLGTLYAIVCPLAMAYSSRHFNLWHYDDRQSFFYGVAFIFNVVTAAYFNLLRNNFEERLHALVKLNTQAAFNHLKTLQFNAIHDVATGLLNRQGVVEAILHATTRPVSAASPLTVVSLRFDRVVEIANIVGVDNIHLALTQLTEQLRAKMSNRVEIGRTRLDELVIVCQPQAHESQIVELLDGLEQLQDLSALGGFSIQDEFNFGVAIHQPSALENGPNELLRKSELALLYAIEQHQRWQVYDLALDAHFVLRHTLYEKIRIALLNKSFQLYYQPQIDLQTNQVIGAEALARWLDPDNGFISPDIFIPIIESTGLLKKFSIWTALQATGDCAHWQAVLPGVTVSLNLSANALLDPDVIQALEEALGQTKVTPSLINVELTESVMLNSPGKAIETMHRIVELGMGLSIDDYGAGCSSLTYVKEFPAREIKIDKSFILNLNDSPRNLAIVKSTIDLGHAFGLQVLAEGVEDAATLARLQHMGCDLGQGWHFAKALPMPEFLAWVHAYPASTDKRQAPDTTQRPTEISPTPAS